MRSFPVALFAIACGALPLILAAGPKTQQAKPRRCIQLFDGKTLNGWEGNRKYWSVRDGMIVGRHDGIRHNEFLCTERSFADFELKLEFRLVGGRGNSGIQFRSKRVPNSTEVSGYQADIGPGWWGALYDESRRNRLLARPEGDVRKRMLKALKPDGWNRYVIRAEGRHITLVLNGVKTVDYNESDPKIPQTGVIGLQIHGGPPMEIHFRNIVLCEL